MKKRFLILAAVAVLGLTIAGYTTHAFAQQSNNSTGGSQSNVISNDSQNDQETNDDNQTPDKKELNTTVDADGPNGPQDQGVAEVSDN